MTRHRAGVPKIARLSRGPTDDGARRSCTGCEQRGSGDTSRTRPKITPVGATNKSSGRVVHDGKRMCTRGPLEGVSLPKGQNQRRVCDACGDKRRSTRRVGPVKSETFRPRVAKSEGNSLGHRVSTWADKRSDGVRQSRQSEKTSCDAGLNESLMRVVFHN